MSYEDDREMFEPENRWGYWPDRYSDDELAAANPPIQRRSTEVKAIDDMSREEAEALAAVAARRLAELDRTESKYGKDRKDGAVIRFAVSQGGRSYTYAALRASGKWYLTGRDRELRTWDQLCTWMAARRVVVVEDIYFAEPSSA